MVVDPSSNAPSIREIKKTPASSGQGQPQPNSLASALGMMIDNSSNAPAIREVKKAAAGPVGSKKSFMQSVMERAAMAGDDL